MDNQHKHIKGYRDLSKEEIDLMNEIKVKGAEVGELIKKLSKLATNDPEADRWVEIGKMDLQKGFMALTRSVARPTFF